MIRTASGDCNHSPVDALFTIMQTPKESTMHRFQLSSGALACLLFFGTVYLLAIQLPGYSHVSQTISEVGKIGSPVAAAFQVGMLAVNVLLILFGLGLFRYARAMGA